MHGRRAARGGIGWLAAIGVALALAGCGERRVPTRAPAQSSYAIAPAPPSVTVRPGDTVYGIARRYGLPVRDVIAANGLAPPYLIAVGQTLQMPQARYHTVAAGDTVYNVAQRYGVQQAELARENAIQPPYTIHVGQRLRLPAARPAGSEPAPAAAAPATDASAAPTPMLPPPQTVSLPASPGEDVAFSWPLQGRVLSRFGAKVGGLHNDGINIAAPRGTEVRAAEAGVVAYVGNELRGFGNLLLIRHAGGWMTAYAHNDALLVRRGDRVRRGQAVAVVGSSGSVAEPQLHFEIRRGGQAVDPAPLLGTTVVQTSTAR